MCRGCRPEGGGHRKEGGCRFFGCRICSGHCRATDEMRRGRHELGRGYDRDRCRGTFFPLSFSGSEPGVSLGLFATPTLHFQMLPTDSVVSPHYSMHLSLNHNDQSMSTTTLPLPSHMKLFFAPAPPPTCWKNAELFGQEQECALQSVCVSTDAPRQDRLQLHSACF